MAEVVAETERLRLRTWDDADLDEFVRHTNTPAVMRWLGGVWPLDQHRQGFERIQAIQRDHGHTLWLVERKADAALLGFCGLKRVNSPGGEAMHGEFEVGWRLREDAWGQGYAKEAAIAALDLAFDTLGADHVVALTVPGNRDSQKLMWRLGMHRRPDLDFIDPRFDDPGDLNPSIIHRIDAAEWPAARTAALGPR
ncbi:GNAT family N-acetyltransferase [Sphingomonas sabuli]|uniref:GNAT family N-acetyltransferase n=1 Tax=Sphingomonas sabuli TaxID=2764186 RepID=A0A7G9L1Z3_9SPHN|nr:GNAT family N-acetyltransferase [Sphingomonas sabuli]QNM82642.1 GNAT family N-acetyltransferase [Sphingomonas sabuli]